jgi:hypothetical protein
MHSDDQVKENARDGGCGALRGEEKYVQGCGGESGRKLADDLEDLNVGLSVPLRYIF